MPKRKFKLRPVRATFDAITPSVLRDRHWKGADYLSADAAASQPNRALARSRARYEIANNSFAKGIVLTLANHVIGRGPRLRVMSSNAKFNAQVQARWEDWCQRVKLAQKLRTAWQARIGDGESFRIMRTNPRNGDPVSLDIMLVEADQVTSPTLLQTPRDVDGITFDEWGNPTSYSVLKRHPGDMGVMSWSADDAREIPAEYVIHSYRVDRPGQSRGMPEILPALPVLADLRRYRLAVIRHAEVAAANAMVLESNMPADDDDDDATGDGSGDTETPVAMDRIYLEHDLATVLPNGMHLNVPDPKQPSAQFEAFCRDMLREAARCVLLPYCLTAGDSSNSNYSSGQLDHKDFLHFVRMARDEESDAMDRIFVAWRDEALTVPGYFASRGPASFGWVWNWDAIDHADPVKERNGDLLGLQSGTTSIPTIMGTDGLDWREEFANQAACLGVTIEEYQALLREKLYGMATPQEEAPPEIDGFAKKGGGGE